MAYNGDLVRDVVLAYLSRGGYAIPTAQRNTAGVPGDLVILQGRGHRALARFELRGEADTLGPAIVEELSNQMGSLQAERGFLITNAAFSANARSRAREAGVAVLDGQALDTLLNASGSSAHRPPEEPLPFARFIPWFVGISLALIVALVLGLVSVALTLYPV